MHVGKTCCDWIPLSCTSEKVLEDTHRRHWEERVVFADLLVQIGKFPPYIDGNVTQVIK